MVYTVGTGLLSTRIHTKVEHSYSLFTAQKILIPLRDKVHNELKQMKASGIISKVDQPTEWCSGMVVVQKKSGGVRICVDLKPLNKSIQQEVYPMPHAGRSQGVLQVRRQ